MNYITQDINIFAIVILLFLLFNYKNSFKFGNLSEKLFIILIISNIVLLSADTISVVLSGFEGTIIRYLIYGSRLVFFNGCLVLCVSWLYFYIARINRINKLESVFLKYIIPMPFVLFNIFMYLTINKGYIFSISSSNEYIRGPLFHLTTICGFLYIVGALIFIILKRKELNKEEITPYILLPLAPILLGLIQSLYEFEILFVWPAIAIILNGMHLYIMNSKATSDHLTGLNNRMELDKYLKRICKEHIQKKQSLGIIMMDIDLFKDINDKYGHLEGDEALKNSADILKDSLSGTSFLARYGGDEFCIISSNCNIIQLEGIVRSIKNATEDKNILNKPYKIEFSMGAKVFYGKELLKPENILDITDKLMYINKKEKKEARKK